MAADDIEVIHMTAVEWDRALQASLDDLGLTWDQLTEQAKAGDFTSLKARQLWLMAAGHGPNQASTEMERLKADLEAAYAERDQQFERKVAALRERDEAKQQLAEAQRTIAVHERHINDTFETNRRNLQKAREQRDEAQDERDTLKAELERLRAELAEVKAERDTNFSLVGRLSTGGFACATQLELMTDERDALKTAIRSAMEVYMTHWKTVHPSPQLDCAACGMWAWLSRDLPRSPDGRTDVEARLAALADSEAAPDAPAKPRHIGGRANAEDCPACHGTNPPYPFICPGEPEGEHNEYVTCSECGSEPTGNYPVAHKSRCSRMTIAPHLWPSIIPPTAGPAL